MAVMTPTMKTVEAECLKSGDCFEFRDENYTCLSCCMEERSTIATVTAYRPFEHLKVYVIQFYKTFKVQVFGTLPFELTVMNNTAEEVLASTPVSVIR